MYCLNVYIEVNMYCLRVRLFCFLWLGMCFVFLSLFSLVRFWCCSLLYSFVFVEWYDLIDVLGGDFVAPFSFQFAPDVVWYSVVYLFGTFSYCLEVERSYISNCFVMSTSR